MMGEDGEVAEEEDSPIAEDELPVIVKRAAAPRLQEQRRKETALEVAGHIGEDEGMAEVGELTIRATCATNGGTDLLNALKRNKLAREERLSHNLRKQRHHPKKQKMYQKHGKL